MLSSDNDSEGSTPPRHPPRRPPRVDANSPAGPAMPSALTSVASLVQPQDADQWRVRLGDDVPKFIFANAPSRITRYNWTKVVEKVESARVTRLLSSAKTDLSDIFLLTTAGKAMLGSLIGWRVEFACTGRSAYLKAPPNCQRICCGTFGECLPSCSSRARYRHCSVRVVLSATLADIAAGVVLISLRGEHVPRGSAQPVPPPLKGLKPMPEVLNQLARDVAGRLYPSVAVNNSVATLGEGVERNTRLAPPARAVAGRAARNKRKDRGGSMDDFSRSDVLVRTHLIQRDNILFYRPGEQLVLTTAWALERARTDGARMVTTDAKVDTVTKIRSKWSSFRAVTPSGLSVPLVVSISPDETAETIERFTTALARNVQCHDPTCPHTVIEKHGADGSYERSLICVRDWYPACCLDKHIPSFNGLTAAGLTQLFLCDYHGYMCFDVGLIKLGILGQASDQINWAFR